MSVDGKTYVWSQIKYELPQPPTSLHYRFSADGGPSPTATDLGTLAPKPGEALSTLYVYNCTSAGKCSAPTAISPVGNTSPPLKIEFADAAVPACPAHPDHMATITYSGTLEPTIGQHDSVYGWRLPLPSGLMNGNDNFVERLCTPQSPNPDPDPPAGEDDGD